MSVTDIALMRRWRGAILEYVYNGHRHQQSRMDGVALWGMMQDFGHMASLNDVITMLQQLRDREYLTFEETRNKYTNEISITKIQITPEGCDLVEGLVKEDPAVRIL
ncbi:hypothetical protein Acid345_3404 [Candidatus Koribacter versatilis Ellin345]|uniref:Uncharacterized protein n=1 Tax=Koribacter versatilis (strain Ellin345) TaxID=204669 RepID=Q1IL45_KORVE|nr:hypothetical protein [Candidatus Koribacter versatilis]ABF42405.1 hypothetical protein Acid345_3404 [Candidatus Koribacter versatilis Ellin345]